MIILLPDENVTMVQLLKDLTHNPLTKIVNSLRQRSVNLYLPRFSMNYSTKLSTILKKVKIIPTLIKIKIVHILSCMFRNFFVEDFNIHKFKNITIQ